MVIVINILLRCTQIFRHLCTYMYIFTKTYIHKLKIDFWESRTKFAFQFDLGDKIWVLYRDKQTGCNSLFLTTVCAVHFLIRPCWQKVKRIDKTRGKKLTLSTTTTSIYHSYLFSSCQQNPHLKKVSVYI